MSDYPLSHIGLWVSPYSSDTERPLDKSHFNARPLIARQDAKQPNSPYQACGLKAYAPPIDSLPHHGRLTSPYIFNADLEQALSLVSDSTSANTSARTSQTSLSTFPLWENPYGSYPHAPGTSRVALGESWKIGIAADIGLGLLVKRSSEHDERNHVCATCGKAFRSRADLKCVFTPGEVLRTNLLTSLIGIMKSHTIQRRSDNTNAACAENGFATPKTSQDMRSRMRLTVRSKDIFARTVRAVSHVPTICADT